MSFVFEPCISSKRWYFIIDILFRKVILLNLLLRCELVPSFEKVAFPEWANEERSSQGLGSKGQHCDFNIFHAKFTVPVVIRNQKEDSSTVNNMYSLFIGLKL